VALFFAGALKMRGFSPDLHRLGGGRRTVKAPSLSLPSAGKYNLKLPSEVGLRHLAVFVPTGLIAREKKTTNGR